MVWSLWAVKRQESMAVFLPKRVNWVNISRDTSLDFDGTKVAYSIEEALARLLMFKLQKNLTVFFIIGGGEILNRPSTLRTV